jgi:hypothetical protein
MSDQTAEYRSAVKTRGFLLQDILWAFGIFVVIFGLTPIIVCYLLMMN